MSTMKSQKQVEKVCCISYKYFWPKVRMWTLVTATKIKRTPIAQSSTKYEYIVSKHSIKRKLRTEYAFI
jgi:hypothetical protein